MTTVGTAPITSQDRRDRFSRPTAAARIVVADDHPMYLDAVSCAIKAAPDLDLVGTARDGAEALALIERERPDVAVLDIEMPVHRGPAVAARLRHLDLPTRVLFLSGHCEGEVVYDALEAGGFGYVSKSMSLVAIRQAILDVAGGGRRLGEDLRAGVIGEIQLRHDRGQLELTAREQAVLALAAQGLTVVGMGRALHLSPATVKVHLGTLYAKLGVNDRASAVAEALRRGLVS